MAAPGPGQGTGLPWESAAQPEPQRLLGKPGLLGRGGRGDLGREMARMGFPGSHSISSL